MDHTQYQRPTPVSDDDFNPAELPPSSAIATRSGNAAPAELAAVLEALRMQNVWLERIAVMVRATRDDREERALPVKIADVNMPFIHMVGLMIKAMFAAIPAVVIAIVTIAMVLLVCGGTTLLTLLAAIMRR